MNHAVNYAIPGRRTDFQPGSGNSVPGHRASTRGRLASGAPNPVDVHIGKRLRMRRVLIGLSQEDIADAVGLTFQQIQKYESATNRVSTSRLWDLASALHCPVAFFYEGMNEQTAAASPRHLRDGNEVQAAPTCEEDAATHGETLRLLRAYYMIRHPSTRRSILDLASSLSKAPEAPAPHG